MSDFSSVEMFAAFAIIISIVRYGTYLWAIYKREARPHVFTWFNLGLVSSIGTYAQFSLNGGPSVWVLAFMAATCLFISFIALFVGEKNITKSDWAAFIGGLLAIPVWVVTDDPVFAIVIIVMIDFLSMYPTIRKSWNDPWGEPPVSYFWGGLRYFFAVLAVSTPSFETLVYPVFLMMMDWGFMIYILIRRRALEGQKHA